MISVIDVPSVRHFPVLPSFGLNSWKSYILPVACLAFNPIAYIARQIRSSMLEAMEQDYVDRNAPRQGRFGISGWWSSTR